jgi:hypothetical protein
MGYRAQKKLVCRCFAFRIFLHAVADSEYTQLRPDIHLVSVFVLQVILHRCLHAPTHLYVI